MIAMLINCMTFSYSAMTPRVSPKLLGNSLTGGRPTVPICLAHWSATHGLILSEMRGGPKFKSMTV